MKAVLFDYGGTIDTNGVHWSEKFRDAYESLNLFIPKEKFSASYGFATNKMDKFIDHSYDLFKTIHKQISMQINFLKDNYEVYAKINSEEISQAAAKICYDEVIKSVQNAIPLLKKLKEKYKLAIVSNYHGNLNSVLNEVKILEIFDETIDSSIVNIWKPDPEIFSLAIKKFNLTPAECFVIGDSYERDIEPAKSIGCKTIWLKGRSWKEENESVKADFIISNLIDAENILLNN